MNKLINKSFLIIGSISALLLTACADPWTDGSFEGYEQSKLVKEKDVTLTISDNMSAAQKAYSLSTWDTIDEFASGRSDYSQARGNVLPITEELKYAQVADNPEFKNARIFQDNFMGEPAAYNLIPGKDYYYRLGATKESFTGEGIKFTTATELPRVINIDGVSNVRDLGGYPSKLGGTIKYNMYIRGATLQTSNKAPEVHDISDEGMKELTQVIGVKTEIDVRSCDKDSDRQENGNMDNTTFPELEYYSFPMSYFRSEIHTDKNLMTVYKEEVKGIFNLLSDETNYPVYLHCSIGTDRTGMVSYLLGALLGLDNDDLHHDYLWSNFSYIKEARTIHDIQNKYYPTLKEYGKGTLQLCAEAYLLDIGVTQTQINNIKNIMIEK